jgi:hypothetical protein
VLDLAALFEMPHEGLERGDYVVTLCASGQVSYRLGDPQQSPLKFGINHAL